MPQDQLPARYQPTEVSAGPAHLRQRVSTFARNDLQQLLCEAMEALEQLESGMEDAQRALWGWRDGTLSGGDAAQENYPTGAGAQSSASGAWVGPVDASGDADGLVSVLPRIYPVDRYQWSAGGRPLSVAAMSRNDLMQALCDCVSTLDEAQRNLQRLLGLTLSWSAGTLQRESEEVIPG